jgi:hypothetical protein
MSIAAPGSRIGLYVVPTDEELMIARHTLALLAARAGQPAGAGARSQSTKTARLPG